jgi:hypothetical protein
MQYIIDNVRSEFIAKLALWSFAIFTIGFSMAVLLASINSLIINMSFYTI